VPDAIVQKLQNEVIHPLKSLFVGRDEVIDLIALAVVAGEHLFLYGPPGTAKSALIREFARAVEGRYFEYMLTRFSEPNEIFGPIDIARLREGTVVTVTTGMLPEAEFVFLDELFNANSAILNNLLTVLNERVYRRGAETHRLPILSLFSASNHLPEDDALRALFDRFLLRCHVDSLRRDAMPQLLAAGWALEQAKPLRSSLSAGELSRLATQIGQADFSDVLDRYIEMVFKLRDLGIALSDRRAIKIMKLLAASALLCGRTKVAVADFWVLRYVWDRDEQIDPLTALVNGVLDRLGDEGARHPLAHVPPHQSAEEVARRLEAVEKEIDGGKLALNAIARLKEQLADLSDQAAWLDEAARGHLTGRLRICLERLE
jgi:MoxR-like ATPase